jgi:hypothetical protein
MFRIRDPGLGGFFSCGCGILNPGGAKIVLNDLFAYFLALKYLNSLRTRDGDRSDQRSWLEKSFI